MRTTSVSEPFFEGPIVNSPYDYPDRHWELDESGQPTEQLIKSRRKVDFITPIPKPKRRSRDQAELGIDDVLGDDKTDQRYHASIIQEVRSEVDRWRHFAESQWQVSPETARLLKHWRHHEFSGIRPFFCQVEAVETAIWLSEVAPTLSVGKRYIDHLKQANQSANPGLNRLALKLATGAGKTTVMAMLIAWQTVNAVRRPNSKRFTRGFLLVAPGITIKDRLRVLQPNDPDSYFKHRDLVPADMLPDLERARIVITNYHAFKLRDRMEISAGGRRLMKGRSGEDMQTLETDGQMLQRVMPELMGMKQIMVLNDEAHHCYRERPEDDSDEDTLKGEDKKDAEKNSEAARLWINGIEAVQRKLGVARVMDLSATPFFLSGSGYREGTLFPWTMSDFSLMDAIECGIVKLPRVPIADNIPANEMPMLRNLWEHIGKDMPKKGRGAAKTLDPESLPAPLKTALEALYGHYEKTFSLWQSAGIEEPPCFIVVCNNTATSKLVYDYISGYGRELGEGDIEPVPGKLELFRNQDEHGEAFPRPRALLIDSEQLESGEALDKQFRAVAGAEIEQFRREIIERGDHKAADSITDQDLLREVMNTVGKKGRLGETIRCVVSVSMLTEGWDANTVTHVLGVRAFGTQLLCEQVIGRGLRRQSYDLNEQGLFNVEYADVLGIPFDFTANPVEANPQKPRETVTVKAISPERDAHEIQFPRVRGYRVERPTERLHATFEDDHKLLLTPLLVGPTQTRNAGIVGETADLNLEHTEGVRRSTIVYNLTSHLLNTKWREDGQPAPMHLFGQLKRITKQWLDTCLECTGDTYPAQILYKELADRACERITAAISHTMEEGNEKKALLDPYNPTGTTRHVNFTTSKTERWEPAASHCHLNWVILDSGWEGEFCRVLESHPKVIRYVKNHNLGFEVPYLMGGEPHVYRPDFIVHIDDGQDDPLQLIVEVKGFRGEDVKDKSNTVKTYWVPGVNNLKRYGRWAFVELRDVFEMENKLTEAINTELDKVLSSVLSHDT